MDDWRQLTKDPAYYFLTLGVSAILGVWWARMTPPQSNVTLIIGVVFIGLAAAFKFRRQPLLVRSLWVGAAVCLSGLFVYYQLWTPRAETLEATKKILTPVENTEYRDLVAEVIHSFEPHAYISVAGAVLGPDGVRTVDIQVWPVSGGIRGPTVIDVIDRPDGKPVGIEAIDAADSKRRDVRANAMLLCSNTGFDASAIQKAKRAKIGLISALKQGDKRIKGKIEEEIFLRKVNINPITMHFEGETVGDKNILDKYLKVIHDFKYAGGSVDAWLQQRAFMTVIANPRLEHPLIARFALKRPTEFLVQGHQVTLQALSIQFHPHVQWLSQIVTLDAKMGIYDYLHGRVQFAGGPNSYTISGINFDTAKPLSSAPDIPNIGVGLHPGEFRVDLIMVEGVNFPKATVVAKLDELVKPEDLSLTITGSPPVQAGGQAEGK